jgi:hypothetical protein
MAEMQIDMRDPKIKITPLGVTRLLRREYSGPSKEGQSETVRVCPASLVVSSASPYRSVTLYSTISTASLVVRTSQTSHTCLLACETETLAPQNRRYRADLTGSKNDKQTPLPSSIRFGPLLSNCYCCRCLVFPACNLSTSWTGSLRLLWPLLGP